MPPRSKRQAVVREGKVEGPFHRHGTYFIHDGRVVPVKVLATRRGKDGPDVKVHGRTGTFWLSGRHVHKDPIFARKRGVLRRRRRAGRL